MHAASGFKQRALDAMSMAADTDREVGYQEAMYIAQVAQLSATIYVGDQLDRIATALEALVARSR